VYISTVFATARSLTNPVLGVDACKSGWVAVRIGESVTAHFAEHVADLPTDVAVIAIDIPIGLPARGRRTADVEARALLGLRRSSVFLTPVRAALAEETHARASAVNRELADEGMSIQAFGLFPKIREVDTWRRTVPYRIVEAHPELSFREMAGTPLADAKKTWAGLEHRRALLAGQGIHLPADLGEAGRKAAPDDILDAAAVAWTAARVAAGTATPLPNPPDEYDDASVAIWR
jgi:predicted RNase H-like nuclease